MIQDFWVLFFSLLSLVASEAIMGVGSSFGVLPGFACDFGAICF